GDVVSLRKAEKPCDTVQELLEGSQRAGEVFRVVPDDDLEGVLQRLTGDDGGRCVDEIAGDHISDHDPVSRLDYLVGQRITIGVCRVQIDDQLTREDLLNRDGTVYGCLVEERVGDLATYPCQQRIEPRHLCRRIRAGERGHHGG